MLFAPSNLFGFQLAKLLESHILRSEWVPIIPVLLSLTMIRRALTQHHMAPVTSVMGLGSVVFR